MATRFDAFAKALADNVTRRSALSRLGAGVAALFIGSTAAACDVGASDRELTTGPASRAVSAAPTAKCKCKSNQVCFGSGCTCPPGTQLCGATGDCVAYCGAGQVLDASCACVSYCGTGQAFCNGACVSTACTGGQTFDPTTCTCIGGCAPGTTSCSGTCTNLQTDVNNCGTCGTVCSFANASAACVGGVCTIAACNSGFGNCDGNSANGCETSTSTNVSNCGACGQVCSVVNGTAACIGSQCAIASCNPGFANCDGIFANGCETNTTSNAANCGACGNDCGAYSCANSACRTTCSVDTDCRSGSFFCNGSGLCLAKGPTGTTCTSGNQCISGICNTGVCL